MDTLAKSFWIHLVTSSPGMPAAPAHAIQHEGWQLWDGHTKIRRPSLKQLYRLLYTPITLSWWRRHNFLSSAAQTVSDWDTTATVMRRLCHPVRMWVTKMASQNCGIGITLQKWKFQDHAQCPWCQCPCEDNLHVYRCTSQGAEATFRKSLRKLRRTLTKADTSPKLKSTLIRCLKRWYYHKHLRADRIADEGLRQAVLDQQSIGWHGHGNHMASSTARILQPT